MKRAGSAMTTMFTVLSQRCRRFVAWSAVLVVVLVTVRPASGQVAVTSGWRTERSATPGETYQGAITLHNATDTTQMVTLSLADYGFDAAGSSSFGAPGSNVRSNASWITLSQQAVSVPPQGTQVVGYTVIVPAGASADMYILGAPAGIVPSGGTYWSVVLVEGEDRSPAPADPSEFTITPKIRYAVQLVTHVGQTGECQLAFGAPRVQTGTMQVDITGAGTRACRPNLKLEVYNSDGALQQATTLRGSYLYPGTSFRQKFDMAPLTPGAYSFLLLADVGADRLQGARFQVQVK